MQSTETITVGEAPEGRLKEITVRPQAVFAFEDPLNESTIHIETLLPFSEAVKLERGNANVRTASSATRPFKAMVDTAEKAPRSFHLFNRGLTYLLPEASYNPKQGTVTLRVPERQSPRSGQAKFGIADGGHTFAVVTSVMEGIEDYRGATNWVMPYVRVRFIVNVPPKQVREIVEAVNTSLQVKAYTLDEYSNKFDWIKRTLQSQGFDIDLVAFRENESKPWHVLSIIQRLSMFLVERWEGKEPLPMYKSKQKALDLFSDNKVRQEEFRPLEDVLLDIVTLPELIQHMLSTTEILKGKRMRDGKGFVKLLKKEDEGGKPYTPAGTKLTTWHKFDNGILLALAAAFRCNLRYHKPSERYQWRVPLEDLIRKSGLKLYTNLADRMHVLPGVAALLSDETFWSSSYRIVDNALKQMTEK
jgi:hypothetical protein